MSSEFFNIADDARKTAALAIRQPNVNDGMRAACILASAFLCGCLAIAEAVRMRRVDVTA